MSKTHADQATTTATADHEADGAGSSTPLGDAMARMILGPATAPADLAQRMVAEQRYSVVLLEYIARTFGNDVFNQTVAEYARLKAAHGEDEHAGAAADRAGVAKAGAADPIDARAPDPTDRLPYDGKGGWNAVEINRNLGQHDRLAGTDSDGARCAYAATIAAHVFEGPLHLVDWLKAYTVQKSPGTLTDRQAKAASIMIGVNDAILAGTATYGDLSWLQEALHAFQSQREDVGPEHASEMIATKDEVWSEPKVVCTSPAEVVAATRHLRNGERAYLEWHAEYPATATDVDRDGDGARDGKAFDHMMMIVNDRGTIYLYDAEHQADGAHLHEVSAKGLKPYFASKYAVSTITVAVTSRRDFAAP